MPHTPIIRPLTINASLMSMSNIESKLDDFYIFIWDIYGWLRFTSRMKVALEGLLANDEGNMLVDINIISNKKIELCLVL